MSFQFQPMNAAAARTVLSWIYPPPYHIYNEDPERLDQLVQELLRPDYHYYVMMDGHDPLVAYCCFGLDARVGGGDYGLDALDIGLMVRPDLNGRGRGAEYAGAALQFARERFPQRQWRVTIAEFNQRAQRVWNRVGFERVQAFARQGDGMPFGVWVLNAAEQDGRPRKPQTWKGAGAPRITGPTNRI